MPIFSFSHPFILTALATFATTLVATWFLIPKIRKAGYLGVDLNKLPPDFDRSKLKDYKTRGYPGLVGVPRAGGIAMVFGFSVGMLVSLAVYSYQNIDVILAALLSATLICMIGVVEDFFPIRQVYRVILPGIAALPLMVVTAGQSSMTIPFIGPIQFGIWYSLIVVPLGVMAASNLVNLLGGFNGVEAGVGLVVSSVLFFVSYSQNAPEAALTAMALASTCAAFLVFNWYPSKIFPGNSATYMIGAVIAVIAIVGNMERVAVVALAPQIFEFFLKARGMFRGENFGRLGKDGRLSYDGPVQSLSHLLMKLFRPTETQLVTMLLALQAAAGALALVSIFL
jgi:UDP-N-acetylglucosamine--dolichyl-phosphate N-acetylglucosaminephosphotransferase